jgi:hypothetical protein
MEALMRRTTPACLRALVILISAWCFAQQESSPSLTIYNQNFAVVRQSVPLDLKTGVNHVLFSDITAHAEPESVVLRELSGGHLQILEQNYRNDPISEGLLLNLFEGKTLDFDVGNDSQGHPVIVQGRVVRSGYVPHVEAYQRYGQQYAMAQMTMTSGGAGQPVIEVNGKLQFNLPGRPIFPSLGTDTILKPTFDWQLQSPEGGHRLAELSYVSGGMSWHADYNIVAPETGDIADVVGWVTLDNQSGKTFDNARIKLMAGDVSKIQPPGAGFGFAQNGAISDQVALPPVTEKSFDEYHLYTLERPTTLRDREIKQVEFLRAMGVHTSRIYVYDGVRISQQYRGWNMETIRDNANYGNESNPKIWVMLEFKNSKSNSLGMPLPQGRVRFYRRDHDGQMEFTGEDKIDHTPTDETVRLYTGNAFDVVGERRRTYYKHNAQERWTDESFEVKLRNHKSAPVEVRVVEHLYRWSNWAITQKSDDFQKINAQTIEFRVSVLPDTEKTVTYTAHYSW